MSAKVREVAATHTGDILGMKTKKLIRRIEKRVREVERLEEEIEALEEEIEALEEKVSARLNQKNRGTNVGLCDMLVCHSVPRKNCNLRGGHHGRCRNLTHAESFSE